MLKFEKTFRFGISLLFAMNVISTLIAMSLIQRLIPANDAGYKLLVEQSDTLDSIVLGQAGGLADDQEGPERKAGHLLLLDDKSLWDKEQLPYLQVLTASLKTKTETIDQGAYLKAWAVVQALQKNRLASRRGRITEMGLAASWVVGLLSLVSLASLWIFQNRMKRLVVRPAAELVLGLQDWWQGNRQRRLRCPKAVSEIHESAQIVNDILDHKAHHPGKF